jgi:hypothetical protein
MGERCRLEEDSLLKCVNTPSRDAWWTGLRGLTIMLSAQIEQSEAKEDGARAYQKRDPETDVLFEQG